MCPKGSPTWRPCRRLKQKTPEARARQAKARTLKVLGHVGFLTLLDAGNTDSTALSFQSGLFKINPQSLCQMVVHYGFRMKEPLILNNPVKCSFPMNFAIEQSQWSQRRLEAAPKRRQRSKGAAGTAYCLPVVGMYPHLVVGERSLMLGWPSRLNSWAQRSVGWSKLHSGIVFGPFGKDTRGLTK